MIKIAEVTSLDPAQIATRLEMTLDQSEVCENEFSRDKKELIFKLLSKWRESEEGVRHGVNQLNVINKACGI